MAFHNFRASRSEPKAFYGLWERFTHRDPMKYHAENARLNQPTQLPNGGEEPLSSEEVIERFITHFSNHLERNIPHRCQSLRDYLDEATSELSRISGRTVEDDITAASSKKDIALLDDRQRHLRCAELYGRPCKDCYSFSANLSIPQLYRKLSEDRNLNKAEKRIIFIPNLTSAGALALAATCARRTAKSLRNFLDRYLSRKHCFSISVSWGFFLEFHLPYHAIRKGPPVTDQRNLRRMQELPLRQWSTDQEDLYFYEAQTSSLSLGPDESFWTEYFIVDTYFGSEPRLHEYLSTLADPALGGIGLPEGPCFDPREYFLLKIERRIQQVTAEYTALIEAFDKRMNEYAEDIKHTFQDNQDMTTIQTLNEIIATVEIFANCISAIVDAWETFQRSQLKFLVDFAPDKLSWPQRVNTIIHYMDELRRLRTRLLERRHVFKFRLRMLQSILNLRQSRIAMPQADHAVILTNIIVYFILPMCFTTALFIVDSFRPTYPWVALFGVLIMFCSLNYILTSSGRSFLVSFLISITRFNLEKHPKPNASISIDGSTLLDPSDKVEIVKWLEGTHPHQKGLEDMEEKTLPGSQAFTGYKPSDNNETFEDGFAASLVGNYGFSRIWQLAIGRMDAQTFHTVLVKALRHYAAELLDSKHNDFNVAVVKFVANRSKEISRLLWIRILVAFGEDAYDGFQLSSKTIQTVNETNTSHNFRCGDSEDATLSVATEEIDKAGDTNTDPSLGVDSALLTELWEGEEGVGAHIPPLVSVWGFLECGEPFSRLRDRLLYTILPSPLHLAVFDNNPGMVDKLLQYDTDIPSIDGRSLVFSGQTLIDVALKNAGIDIIMLLLEHYKRCSNLTVVDQAFLRLSLELKSSNPVDLSLAACKSREKFAFIHRWYQEDKRMIVDTFSSGADFPHYDNLLVLNWEVPMLLTCRGRTINSKPSPRLTTRGAIQITTDQVHAIDNIVTITGCRTEYEAATCKEYLEKHFGETGQDVLDLVKTALNCMNIVGKVSRTSHTIYFCAYEQFLIVRCSKEHDLEENGFDRALLWLCQALRMAPNKSNGGLWVSKVSKSISLEISHGSIMVHRLKPLESFAKKLLGTEGCWNELFGVGVIAEQQVSRPWGRGLALSFRMMTQLADVDNYKWIEKPSLLSDEEGKEEGGYIMIGFFTALIPVAKSPDGKELQWHLECTGDHLVDIQNIRCLESSWLKVKTPADLQTSTCYLGWCDSAHILLGTEKIEYKCGWTDLNKRTRTLHSKGYTAVGQLGGSAGPIQIVAQGGQNYEYVNNKQRFTAPTSYAKAIQISQQHVALVYDNTCQRAWLIPKLSLMLHLCHIYFRTFDSTTPDPIPFAQPSCNGSDAAAKALYDKGDIEVFRHGANDMDVIKLRNILVDISNNLFDTQDIRENPSSSFLFATELMDLVTEPGTGSDLREMPINDCASCWVSLARAADCISVCADLGLAIEPASVAANCDCKTVQPGRKYLGAHLSCLDTLLRRRQRTIHELQKSTINIDKKERWCFKPYMSCSHVNEESYWDQPENFLQSISASTFPYFTQKKPPSHTQSPLLSGAVIFGQLPRKKLQKKQRLAEKVEPTNTNASDPT